jgi:hypothetical protein
MTMKLIVHQDAGFAFVVYDDCLGHFESCFNALKPHL